VKWIAVLACSASTAAADRLVMKETESDNIHIANQGGAINTRADITITVDLLAGGKAKVIATGTRSEHNLYSNFSTDEESKWTTAWTGTWTTGAGTMKIDLAVASDTCSHTKTSSGQAAETLACRAPREDRADDLQARVSARRGLHRHGEADHGRGVALRCRRQARRDTGRVDAREIDVPDADHRQSRHPLHEVPVISKRPGRAPSRTKRRSRAPTS